VLTHNTAVYISSAMLFRDALRVPRASHARKSGRGLGSVEIAASREGRVDLPRWPPRGISDREFPTRSCFRQDSAGWRNPRSTYATALRRVLKAAEPSGRVSAGSGDFHGKPSSSCPVRMVRSLIALALIAEGTRTPAFNPRPLKRLRKVSSATFGA